MTGSLISEEIKYEESNNLKNNTETLENKVTADMITDYINKLDEVTLEDTIDLMKSDDYQIRFIAEYIQTKIRYDRLYKMLIKYEANTLEFEIPEDRICTLDSQLYYMNEYLKTLEVRAELENIKLPNI